MGREITVELDETEEQMVNEMEMAGAEIDFGEVVSNSVENNFRQFKAQAYAQQDIDTLLGE